MPGSQVIAANVLTAGLRSDFWDTYEKTYAGLKDRLSQVMDLSVPSDKLTEIYGYFNSAPYPRRWVRGDSPSNKAFKSVQFSVTNKDYGLRVSWHENDRQDDQTKSLRERAAQAGEHFATLDERVFFQILTASTDTDLLEAIPNAPDGVGLYSATDGDSADRFGVSGGNIESGGGVASSHAVRTDFFESMQRMASFKDTESQPLWDSSILDQGAIVMFNVNNWQVFAEAFLQGRTVGSVASATSAAPTNIIMDAGMKVQLVPTQRIADNDWFVFLKGSRRKPIFKQVRMPMRETIATMENSDSVRDTKVEYMQWDERSGYGVMLPYGTVKVNN